MNARDTAAAKHAEALVGTHRKVWNREDFDAGYDAAVEALTQAMRVVFYEHARSELRERIKLLDPDSQVLAILDRLQRTDAG